MRILVRSRVSQTIVDALKSVIAFEPAGIYRSSMLGKGIVRSAKDVATEGVGAGSGTRRQVLISGDEAPNFALRRFIMEPGGGMPEHTNTVEHEQYILKGRAQVGIGEDIFEVAAGDAVYIPEGLPHWYQADAQEGFEFLCIVPNKEDIIEICGPVET